MLLQILVKLGILLSELGQFQHMCGALIYVVQIMSKRREKNSFKRRTVEFIYGRERCVVVIHVDVRIILIQEVIY